MNNRQETNITKEQLLNEETFKRICEIQDIQVRLKEEQKLFELAKTIKAKNEVEKKYKIYKNNYQIEHSDKYERLDFGEKAPIRFLYSGGYSIKNR